MPRAARGAGSRGRIHPASRGRTAPQRAGPCRAGMIQKARSGASAPRRSVDRSSREGCNTNGAGRACPLCLPFAKSRAGQGPGNCTLFIFSRSRMKSAMPATIHAVQLPGRQRTVSCHLVSSEKPCPDLIRFLDPAHPMMAQSTRRADHPDFCCFYFYRMNLTSLAVLGGRREDARLLDITLTRRGQSAGSRS